MISAKIIKDSINGHGDRITTMKLVFPRFILAELNTHRMFTKNSASSRAIPFSKMLDVVQLNPFIPIAWQKDHKGMQGVEYWTDKDLVNNYPKIKALENSWLQARDTAIDRARFLNSDGVTKQLCNRLLEPFMWHSVILTATEFENFFWQRCPRYYHSLTDKYFRSQKDWLQHNYHPKNPNEKIYIIPPTTTEDWLMINHGQAEIHMMALAEAMWDALNESTPQVLRPGQWHIPYEDKILIEEVEKSIGLVPGGLSLETFNRIKIKISTAMCARESYTTLGDEKEFTIEKQIALHDKLVQSDPKHWSPTEHCAKAMTDDDWESYYRGAGTNKDYYGREENHGWCRNFKGFIQYREILEN